MRWEKIISARKCLHTSMPYNVQTDVRKKPPLCKGRGTAIAVEGLFQREVTSSPNNPTVIFLRKCHPCPSRKYVQNERSA